MPTTYAVASAKGGVGKTTTAANLAATLAAAGFETVAVDGDIGTANLAPALGVDVPPDGATLHDVLAGEADPVDATYRGPHDLAVLPGDESLSAFRTADPSRIREVLASITNADYVIVDTGAGLTHESALPLSLADGVLLVATPTRDALVDTAKTLRLTERLGGTVAGVALNRVGPDDDLESALAAGDIDADEFDVPVLGHVPEDPAVAAAVAAREPLSEHAPGSDAAAAYRSLASSLTGNPIRPPLAYEVEEGEQDPATPDADDATAANAGTATDAAPDADTAPGDDAEAADATGADEESGESGTASADTTDATVPDDEDARPTDGAVESEDVFEGGDDPVEDGPDDAADEVDPGEDPDDAVIIEGDADGEEDGAAADARRTVLGEEEYEEFDGDDPVAVEDAESGEPVDIEEDAIPFADQGDERPEREVEAGDGDDEEADEGTAAADGTEEKGGILSRLFR